MVGMVEVIGLFRLFGVFGLFRVIGKLYISIMLGIVGTLRAASVSCCIVVIRTQHAAFLPYSDLTCSQILSRFAVFKLLSLGN